MTKTIILACVGGLTTSMLVERINETIHKGSTGLLFLFSWELPGLQPQEY